MGRFRETEPSRQMRFCRVAVLMAVMIWRVTHSSAKTRKEESLSSLEDPDGLTGRGPAVHDRADEEIASASVRTKFFILIQQVFQGRVGGRAPCPATGTTRRPSRHPKPKPVLRQNDQSLPAMVQLFPHSRGSRSICGGELVDLRAVPGTRAHGAPAL